MELLHDGAAYVAPFMRSYGLWALFILLYLESLGLPLPGETALIAAVALALAGELPIGGIFLVASAAATLGDNTGYLIGRYGGQALIGRFGKFLGLTPERRAWIERLYETKGPIIVVVARFVIVLRQLNGIVAGTAGMRWRTFLFANAAGAVLWAGAWCLGPYVVSQLFAGRLHVP